VKPQLDVLHFMIAMKYLLIWQRHPTLRSRYHTAQDDASYQVLFEGLALNASLRDSR
jgi:hypothetical protein